MTRVLRGSDGAVEQQSVYLSPEEELRFDGDRVEYRKTVFLGPERVAEVRIGGDLGALRVCLKRRVAAQPQIPPASSHAGTRVSWCVPATRMLPPGFSTPDHPVTRAESVLRRCELQSHRVRRRRRQARRRPRYAARCRGRIRRVRRLGRRCSRAREAVRPARPPAR